MSPVLEIRDLRAGYDGVAVVRDLGVPIRYVGVGETLEDLLPFDAGDFAASLVGEE